MQSGQCMDCYISKKPNKKAMITSKSMQSWLSASIWLFLQSCYRACAAEVDREFIGNALKENAVILTCMSAFSHIILMVYFATGMPLKFREN